MFTKTEEKLLLRLSLNEKEKLERAISSIEGKKGVSLFPEEDEKLINRHTKKVEALNKIISKIQATQ